LQEGFLKINLQLTKIT